MIWWCVPVIWNVPLLWNGVLNSSMNFVTSLNFLIVVGSRNEFFVWFVYILITNISVLLGARSRFKILLNRMAYNLGGLHAGSVLFLIVSLVAQIIIRYDEVDTVCFSALLLVGVLAISIFACPAYRHKQKHHDHFEYSHRFIGWLLAAVVIVQIVYTTVVTNGDPWRSASTYLLVCSVFLVAWPWITMKKVTMNIDAPSKMVTTLTTAQPPVFACAGTAGRVSFGFASQYHSFAILNALTGDKGVTFAVSSVGDWTRKLNAKGSEGGGVYPSPVPKPHTMYVRRFAAPGFMYLARTYKRVVCVGTGAGIAPIASYLPDPTTNMLLLWVGRDFKSTYGALYDTIIKHKDLIMVDTTLPSSVDNPYEPLSDEILYSSAITPTAQLAAMGEGTNNDQRENLERKQSIAELTVAYLEAEVNAADTEAAQNVKIDVPCVELKQDNKIIPAISFCLTGTVAHVNEKQAEEAVPIPPPGKKTRPNLSKLALAAVEVYKADAVFIVSGPKPTYDLTHALWKRGIPAYGATWDS